jgi:hypothetical protein
MRGYILKNTAGPVIALVASRQAIASATEAANPPRTADCDGRLKRFFKQGSDPDQVIEQPSVAFRQPLGPLEEHPLGFCVGAFSAIGLDLFNQGLDFRRWYFEG